jgi:UDP-N-acetylglucosamine--N-acetylmuramyl-(pentapeptide) pyrophosphoryl-undecaprenol N-acetylglucosamine transferase
MTGGGSSGHVTPNFALMPELIKAGFEIEYIGSHNGIEKKLVCNKKNIKYHEISCGKLRRYWSLKNFTDLINIIKGLKEANKLIKKIKPNIIFSKGGFVSVPVVIAGWKNKIPIVIHESDITPGLANKISIPFASCVCTSFKKAAENISKTKTIVTGSPIRDELFLGDKLRAKNNLKLNNMPVILVIGGSLGSIKINNVVRESLDELKNFVVIHICGMGNKKNIIRKNYFEFEYIDKNLADYFCLADMIISRAGSNAIFELLALKKPNLLIPLSKKASRGDQILNAMAFQKKGFSKILYEENLTKQNLLKNIKELYDNKEKYIKAMSESNFVAGNKKIIEQIKKLAKKN